MICLISDLQYISNQVETVNQIKAKDISALMIYTNIAQDIQQCGVIVVAFSSIRDRSALQASEPLPSSSSATILKYLQHVVH